MPSFQEIKLKNGPNEGFRIIQVNSPQRARLYVLSVREFRFLLPAIQKSSAEGIGLIAPASAQKTRLLPHRLGPVAALPQICRLNDCLLGLIRIGTGWSHG